MDLFEELPKNLFFTGKGGVGKTSLSCASAIKLADEGKRVLLVSTDPASNLDEVLNTKINATSTPIAEVPRLFCMNIDPEKAAERYREKVVGPIRNVLPDAVVASIEEQLSGACTVEIAAFDEFAKLLGNPGRTDKYDHVIFDTAPTGHTLRLLQLPAAWDSFLATNTTGTSCLGPLSSLKEQQALYTKTVHVLSDPQATKIVLVSRPDHSGLHEASRTSIELEALGITNQFLVINGVFQGLLDDDVAMSMKKHQDTVLAKLPDQLKRLCLSTIPLQPVSLLGAESLRNLWCVQDNKTPAIVDSRPSSEIKVSIPPVTDIVHLLETQKRGLIMTMGKGGVGKTTMATWIALRLVEGGHNVHLATTDPASHLDNSFSEKIEKLTISCIDPIKETEDYAKNVMETAGERLDDHGRRLLEEDLRSPCTEEIAVFQAFAKLVEKGEDGFIVLDTAPTGHTLLLLDAAEAYHREVSRNTSELPPAVQRLLPRLRDPDYTKIFLVTIPEATPVHEAARLQDDLARAGIRPFGWIINQSLIPLQITNFILSSRRANELHYINEVTSQYTRKAYICPWKTAQVDLCPAF